MNLENIQNSVLIVRLELINFMCHDHLIINFEKQFTCIGGRNGSGKSAIMIALGILFGQRSSSLERGHSYKNLISTNMQEFVIKCILNNTKKYNYDFFGDFIFIEKRVTLKSSSFSIYNKQKKVFSSKVEDLEFLLDFFNIKFDNPLNFLTQEQSKRFLSSSDPSHLYKLFLKGTEIADIKLINEKFEENVNKLKEIIENMGNNIKSINEQLEKENKRLNILENIDNLKNKILHNQNEIKWTEVHKLKKEVEKVEEEISNIEKDILREQDIYGNLWKEIEDYKLEKNTVEEKSKKMREENKIKMTQIEDQMTSTNKKIRNMENDLKVLKDTFNIKKDLVKRLEKLSTVEDEKNLLNNKKIEIEKQIEKTREEQKEINKIYEKEKNIKDEHEKQISEYTKKFYSLQKQIEYCNKSSENDLIHLEMNNIKKVINETNFNEKVIGPICDFIKLKDQKWWKVSSLVLHKLLSSFIVFNKEDRNRLSQIFKKYNVNFSILVPSNKTDKLIKYTRNDNCKILLDVIDCKNNIILNQLILLANIEEKALIENRNEAYKFIRGDPKNIDCAYTINGDIIKKLGGSISDFAPRKIEKYFFEKPRDKQKNYQVELDLLLKNKPIYKQFEFDKISKKNEFILEKCNKLERQLGDIVRQLDSAKEIELYKSDVINNEELTDSFRSLEKQINSLINRIENYKKNITILENDKDSLFNTQYPSSISIENQLQQLKIKLNISKDNIQQYSQKRSGLYNLLKNKNNLVEEARNILLKESQEISNPREKEDIIEEINNIKIEIEESKKVGDKEETQEKINEFINKKEYFEEIVNCNKHNITEISESYKQRIIKREEIKEYIGNCAMERFKDLTLERGYKGSLNFDHKNEKLELKMEVHNFGISGSKETLSGGERSFAAMSLLFSLWPYISCPIKILDEFDVFMDDLNRKYIIKKFIKYFINSNDQVILITPLNTKDLEDDNVDIKTLSSPRD